MDVPSIFSFLWHSTENIYLTGSLDALNAWSPENAILLSSATYPTWSGECRVILEYIQLY